MPLKVQFTYSALEVYRHVFSYRLRIPALVNKQFNSQKANKCKACRMYSIKCFSLHALVKLLQLLSPSPDKLKVQQVFQILANRTTLVHA